MDPSQIQQLQHASFGENVYGFWIAYYGFAYHGMHIIDCILWIAYGASLTKPTVVEEMTPIKRRTLERGFGEPPSAIVVSRLFGT